MARRVTRRGFLGLAAGATALGLGGPSSPGGSSAGAGPGKGRRLPPAAAAPFDTVVVLMMENRSFDHMLGWLPGADGRQEGLWYPDRDGIPQETWALAPDFQGCDYLDPDHTWQGIRDQYADGRCDGFLRTPSAVVGDLFPIGYYGEDDLPVLATLARGYTTFDRYFCSMMGPTWENRLYQLTATTQLIDNCDYPREGEPRPVTIAPTIFDRVREGGLTARYYYHASPITGLFASRAYDDISYPIEQFWEDSRRGTLANVVFVDPDYSDLAEDMGTSNDYHPWGNVLVAESFVGQVHDALKASPQWDRMVFVLNFDEHGGFFDHVPPPPCRDDTELPDLPEGFLQRLGFRVPAIAMGPFAPRVIEHAGPYEHCSILRMIEWRWGLTPLRLRDRHARNLAEALDFTRRRAPIDLPPFTPPPATACVRSGGWTPVAVSRKGWLRVEVSGAEGATGTGRVLGLEDGVDLASGPPRTIGAAQRAVLDLRLTEAGRRLLAEMPDRLSALLETIVQDPQGETCRSTSPALLRLDPGRF